MSEKEKEEKTEVEDTNKTEETDKKGKKEKKPKKVKIPFDQIDITTATEDDIINSGKMNNTPADFFCYFLMFIIFVLMITPLALRAIIPKPITEVVMNIAYVDMECHRVKTTDGYEIVSAIFAKYRNGSIATFEIQHKINKTDTEAGELHLEEIEELQNLEVAGLKKEGQGLNKTFTIDFYNHEELFQNEILEKYSYISGAEINTLREMGYYCSSNPTEVEELVYVDTQRKVEDD